MAERRNTKMSSQALLLVNVTMQDFKNYCADFKKAAYKFETKTEFFDLILKNKLVRDSLTSRLVKTRKKIK